MVEQLKPFTEVRFVTKDGEHISATKKDGKVTVVGDKNGVRQLELNDFMQYMVENAQNVNLENTPTKDTVSFQGKPDDYVHSYEVKATKGKKWAVGIASYCIPGLGQAINGQWGKGFGYLLGTGALASASYGLAASSLLKNGKTAIVGAIAAGIGAVALQISSIVNAVKNAKSTVQVIDEASLIKSENK